MDDAAGMDRREDAGQSLGDHEEAFQVDVAQQAGLGECEAAKIRDGQLPSDRVAAHQARTANDSLQPLQNAPLVVQRGMDRPSRAVIHPTCDDQRAGLRVEHTNHPTVIPPLDLGFSGLTVSQEAGFLLYRDVEVAGCSACAGLKPNSKVLMDGRANTYHSRSLRPPSTLMLASLGLMARHQYALKNSHSMVRLEV